MNPSEFARTMRGFIPSDLAEDLTKEFLQMRQDLATGTLGRGSPGKFVETVVQVLQFLESGRYEKEPKVDSYLREIDSLSSNLDDGLRICASRIARAMYTLRNKRSISHKNGIDVNRYDLAFLLGAAQWVLTELVRHAKGVTMQDAGRLVGRIQAPVGSFVEDFGR